MCGICGIFSSNPEHINESILTRMTLALEHRGPDEEGFLKEKTIGFGHRRLKVIDLETGAQPMTSQDGRVSLIFNGEIYNFKEIRMALEKEGRVFKTTSDTESLLQLYEEKGIDCVRELKGMFAFAVYDRKLNKTYLAVDRFGKKPLYYTESIKPFLFASELRSILIHPNISKQISMRALSQYLSFEYVPAPLSIIEGILKLEAGHYLEVSDRGIQKKRYFEPNFKDAPKSESEWKEILLSRYEKAVRERLVSDVPLGVFLSGGLDSSSVVAMVRKINPDKPIKTFSIRFNESSFDESTYSRQVSRFFRTEHYEELCSLDQMLKEHDLILGKLDEPLADASFIPTYLLCRMTRQHVTVALSGDGGDELFYGYPTFIAHKLAEHFRFIPKSFWKIFARMAEMLPTSMDNLSYDFKLKQFLKGMRYNGLERDQVWLGAFSPEEDILRNPSDNAFQIFENLEGMQTLDSLKKLQAFYFRFYLQGDILVKTDRASMAHSLEVRSPLLDDDLAEAIIQAPSSLKLKGSETKYIFKKSMENLLPKEIIYRPKKGFGIPIAHWIRQDLRGEFERALSRKAIEKDGLFRETVLESLLNEHLSGKKDNRKKLWTLYVFQKWKQNWLDR